MVTVYMLVLHHWLVSFMRGPHWGIFPQFKCCWICYGHFVLYVCFLSILQMIDLLLSFLGIFLAVFNFSVFWIFDPDIGALLCVLEAKHADVWPNYQHFSVPWREDSVWLDAVEPSDTKHSSMCSDWQITCYPNFTWRWKFAVPSK